MKLLLIAIFCISAASASVPLVGGNRCTWGPAYWCKQIETAKECGAVTHCISNVWKHQPVTAVQSTETCLFCKGIVSDIKVLVASKKVQAEIRTLALKACGLVPNKRINEVCNTVVVMFLPEVIQMIENDLHPSTICGLVRLCSASKGGQKVFTKLANLLKIVKSPSSSTCDECKIAVTLAKAYLSKNDTQMEITQFVMNDVCPRLPGDFGAVCKKIAAEILPEVFQNLETILDPNSFCSMFGICPKKFGQSVIHKILPKLFSKLRPNQPLKANPVECAICKDAVMDLRKQLADASVQKEIADFLKNNVCTHLGSLSVQCQQGITQYLPILFQLILTEINPDTTCQYLKLCASSVHRTPMMSINAAKVVRMQQPTARVECVLCEFIMREVDHIIGTNKSEAVIQAALDKVCSILPATISAECTAFVNQYTPLVLKLLIHEVAPDVICKTIGVCASAKEELPTVRGMADSCNLMVRYVHVLSKVLHLNLNDLMVKLCEFVPKSERHSCRMFLESHRSAVLKVGKEAFVSKDFHAPSMCKRILGTRPRPNGLVQLLGSKKCTYGPSYWCASHKNAVECSALKHCQERVWKTMPKLV